MTNNSNTPKRRGIRFILASHVRVKITGTYNTHRRFRDNFCINCGTIVSDDKTISGIPAFVLGTKEPLSHFDGEVIAIAKQRKENKEFWIVAPAGSIFYEPQISGLLSRFLPMSETHYICLYEKSCGAVLFAQSDGVRKYLLIKNMSGHIGFPKGHIEFGEDEKKTAMREVYEETGVRIKITDSFREYYCYTINNFIRKKAVYFLSSFNPANIKMCIREISEYKLLDYNEAYETLSFKHDKDVLEKAQKYINHNYGQFQ